MVILVRNITDYQKKESEINRKIGEKAPFYHAISRYKMPFQLNENITIVFLDSKTPYKHQNILR